MCSTCFLCLHYTFVITGLEGIGLSDALDQLHKAHESRIVSSAQTALILITIVCGFFIIRSITWELYGRVLTNSIAIVFTLSGIYFLRQRGARKIAAILSLLGISTAAGYAAYSSGGITNPAFFWLLILPILGGMIGARSGAIFGSCCSFVVGCILISTELIYGVPENLTPVDARVMQDLAHQIAQLISFALATFFLYQQIEVAEVRVAGTVNALSDEVEARTDAEKHAARASEIKSQFLANMSHEIRTPMNGVLGALSLLENTGLKDRQSEYLDIARSSSNTLMVVINDILDISKIESGSLDIESTPFSLLSLIHDMEQSMSFRASEKGVELRCVSSIAQDAVLGDPVRMRQVMDNLVGNAIKFTSEGQVTIRATLAPVSVDDGSFRLTFEVEDSGIGISSEQQSLLFVPFSQVEASTTRRFGGTGLGLSICKQLVEALGGEISVVSQPGEGSTFSFSIPLSRSETTVDTSLTELAEKMWETNVKRSNIGARVLLVEDNQINATIAEAMLLPLGVEVDFAINGAEAIAKLLEDEGHYQVVFMDCQMPVMDGYSATAEIRKHSQFAELPIISMTANAMKGDREKCLAAGMNDYITKPIDPEVLARKLGEWLGVS